MNYKLRRESGQALSDYAFIIGFIALIVISILAIFGDSLAKIFEDMFSMPTQTTPQAELTFTITPTLSGSETSTPEITGTITPELPTQTPTITPTTSSSGGGTGITPVTHTAIETIATDFLTRILDYYNANGRWPSSGQTRRFTDLGLTASNWTGLVEGIAWNPNGSRVGLSNVKNDNIQVYVQTVSGETLQLYDGWNIWCVASSGQCYYHNVAAGNEVVLSSIYTVRTP
jgi:Flp pilus assembly pilin Flp